MKNIAVKITLVVAVAAISGTVLVSQFSADSAQVAAEPGGP